MIIDQKACSPTHLKIVGNEKKRSLKVDCFTVASNADMIKKAKLVRGKDGRSYFSLCNYFTVSPTCIVASRLLCVCSFLRIIGEQLVKIEE